MKEKPICVEQGQKLAKEVWMFTGFKNKHKRSLSQKCIKISIKQQKLLLLVYATQALYWMLDELASLSPCTDSEGKPNCVPLCPEINKPGGDQWCAPGPTAHGVQSRTPHTGHTRTEAVTSYSAYSISFKNYTRRSFHNSVEKWNKSIRLFCLFLNLCSFFIRCIFMNFLTISYAWISEYFLTYSFIIWEAELRVQRGLPPAGSHPQIATSTGTGPVQS